MRKLTLIFFLNLYLHPYNFNSYGVLGYINVPSAYTLEENSYAFSLTRNNPERFLTFTASPFDWLDATIFYVDITGKEYGGSFTQSYKDKGFNIKISPFELFNHDFALGFNDMAGTGLFQSEYIVFSKSFYNYSYTFGIGWGAFNNGISIDNPLIKIDESFRTRSKEFTGKGGNLEIKDYFSGQKASIFFASSYKINPNTSLELEIDPTNDSVSEIPYKRNGSNYNIGITKYFKDFSLSLSYQRSNSLSLQVSHSKDLSLFNKRNAALKYRKKLDSYKDLQKALEHHNIGLKEITKTNDALAIKVRQNSYYDQNRVDSIVNQYARDYALKENLNEIIVKQYYHGMEMNSSGFNASFLSPSKTSDIDEGQKEYVVIDDYPVINNKLYPTIRNFIASREAFYFGGLFLENDTDLILTNNLFIISNIKYSIYDNFDNLYIEPIDIYPAQVRSDVKDYLKNFNNKFTIGRLELNYFKSPKKDHFLRGSIGIFEEMYGGFGFDYVYSPENSIFSLGFEGYHLKKRDYDMRFTFQEYQNSFLRFNTQLLEPKTDIRAKLSFGEYIAGDKGFTLELSKNFSNGVEFSAFFSRTNVSFDNFGEGSFDKGISIRIPITNLFGVESFGRYVWRPLTKDPGSLLNKSIDLMDEVDRYRFY